VLVHIPTSPLSAGHIRVLVPVPASCPNARLIRQQRQLTGSNKISPTAHRLVPQAESPPLPTARAQNAGRRSSELLRDLPLTRFAPRQGSVSLIPLPTHSPTRRTRVRFPPPPITSVPRTSPLSWCHWPRPDRSGLGQWLPSVQGRRDSLSCRASRFEGLRRAHWRRA